MIDREWKHSNVNMLNYVLILIKQKEANYTCDWRVNQMRSKQTNADLCFVLFIIQISDSHLARKVPASYSDGVYMMGGLNRPNPRKLSQLFMKGEDGLGSVMNRTTLFAFFGQLHFLFSHFLILFSCCRDGDIFLDFKRLEVTRLTSSTLDILIYLDLLTDVFLFYSMTV